ncbi:MAG: RND family transporter [Myxococcales bacterium FL481]|nr:MAG: RND family transporter [Myxococcales bacterium FL481]
MSDLVVRLRWVLIVGFLGVTGFFGLQLPNAELDTDMKSQLPPDLPTRVNLDRIESLFGGTDMVMLVVSADDVLATSTLERLSQLSKKMSRIDEFDRTVSLFTAKDIRAEDDEMLVEQAIERIPKTDRRREALRERLRTNGLVYGNLVSENFRHTVIIGFLKLEASDEVVMHKLGALVEELPGDEEVLIGGMPVTRVSLTKDMRADMRKFLPIGLLLMLVFLFACFRQLRGVLLPFVMTVMAIVVGMGLVPLLGWKIHTVTVLLPVILLAVANDYGIHVLARYQEDNTPGATHTAPGLAKRGFDELWRPILATGVTTMAGLLCLLSHVIIPAAQLGILAAAGVAFAVVGSLTFIPAVLSAMRVPKPVWTEGAAGQTATSRFDRGLFSLARWVPRRPKAIVLGAVVVSTVVGLGGLRLVVDTNPMSFYRRDEPVWQSTHLLNEHLGGWAGVSVLATGDIKDPEVLQEIDALEQHLREHELVGMTTSLAGVVRKMNQVMHSDNVEFDVVPNSRELIAQYLLLYSMSGDPADFEKLVDLPYEHAQIMAKVTDSGTRGAQSVVDTALAYLEAHPDAPFELVGGFLHVMADMVDHIVRGQLLSIGFSVLVVGVLVGLLLRSLVGAVLAMFPLALALALLFGVMGLAGIELNLVTALLSSIMIGVGVDYTIHFLWRYRDERRAGLEPGAAVEKTLMTSGRGIVFNALSVLVGFAVLVVSAFFPVRFFGLLVAVSISACLFGALVVLPAIVLIFRPKFLEPTDVEPRNPDSSASTRSPS